MEKQKLVYVLNRDQAANLTISSPLEAHKSHNIVFSVIGLDMGFDNPVFAAIELDYADADQASDAGNPQLFSSLKGSSGLKIHIQDCVRPWRYSVKQTQTWWPAGPHG